jgi:membrane-bound inhibitor of C-type lysozyme
MRNALIVIGIGAIVLLGGWYLANRNTIKTTNTNTDTPQPQEMPSDDTPIPVQQTPGASIGDENLVQFRCDDGKSITAVFARDIVGVTLSDGRQMELRQSASGSGVRFENIDETIEFHGKGEGAFLVEAGVTTYENCVAAL